MNSPSSNIYADQIINQAAVLQPKLEVINLSKTFTNGSVKKKQGKTKPQLLVLDRINFNIYPNEFVCIVGASGCGKSTLLNIIAGLMAPSSGTVKINNKELLGPDADRGMVFQNYTLFPWLSVAENIAFGLKLKKIPTAQRREIVRYYLEIIGLTKFAHAYPKELSGGMKQ